ncbi:hypothetical protein NDU88_006491 [Pleurodeles waltl]|uniref:Uncharacterized protein n=1 Tax=Pleurodeles waltl TaxID=8319 RepID=A0AAV7UMN1_PLEWA|nr:hypothetical protein NDU88_006491 [Pleurodeles waltl]
MVAAAACRRLGVAHRQRTRGWGSAGREANFAKPAAARMSPIRDSWDLHASMLREIYAPRRVLGPPCREYRMALSVIVKTQISPLVFS